MKLHLPLSLRSALLAVLALIPATYANDKLEADGGNIPMNSIQGARVWYSWGTITGKLKEAADSNSGTITGNISFTLDGADGSAVNRTLDNDWLFTGDISIKLSLGTLDHYRSYLGSNRNVKLDISNGATYRIRERDPEVFTSLWIGKGADSTVDINLTGGGLFVMEHSNGIIADNGAHANIIVDNRSSFSLVNGTIARGNKSYADITIKSGGLFLMSGGMIGTASGATNTITVESGGVFNLSGGYVGYDGTMDITIISGGALMMSGGAFSGSGSSLLKLAGGGSGNTPTPTAPNQANAALFIRGTKDNTVGIAIQLTGNTSINSYDAGSTATFTKAFDFGENTLTKLGQGNITFGNGFTAANVGTISLSRGTLTLDYSVADTLSGLTLEIGGGNANDSSFGLILGSKRYVIDHIADNTTSQASTASISGDGTLIVNYNGDTVSSTSTSMSGGSVSLEKRGSGTQILTGSIDADAITVTAGTLTLGSSGQSISTGGAVTVLSTLNLQSDAEVYSLAGSGTINAAGSLTVRSASGSTSLSLHMAGGTELSVQSGTLSASSLIFGEGANTGTLSVSLTGGVHLDFGSIAAGSITLTLLDEELSSLENGSYALFTHWDAAWGSIITLGEEGTLHVGRKSVTLNATDGTLTISSLGESLTWAGGNLTWETGATGESNWQLGGGRTDHFYSGDSAIFTGSGGTVSIKGRVVADDVTISSTGWTFADAAESTPSLRIVGTLSAGDNGSAGFGNSGLTIVGGVQSSGSLTFSGSALSIEGEVHATAGSLIFSGANTEIQELVSIGGASATFSGTGARLSGGLATTAGASVIFSGAGVSLAGMNLQGGSVTFSGTSTTLTDAATIAGGSTVTFSGTNLDADGKLFIGDARGTGTVILKLSGAANATAANDPTLGTPATGRSLGKVTVAEGSKLVVYGHNGTADTTYTWKQNTVLSTYTSVVGGGTLEFRDLGYQVLSGESIRSMPDQYGEDPCLGSSILFRFIGIRSNETEPEKIHILELSTENKEHATSLAFDRGDPTNGWNPATALLKRIGEIHVKDGAALGFTARNFNDEGIQSGAKVFETTHGVLHLAGNGINSTNFDQGGNAALYVTTEGDNAPDINVSMPWDVVLDADTQINTYKSNTGITFTGEYNGGTHTLTKVGAGSMTFGSGFTTAQGSSGVITASRGKLIFDYDTADALKDYTIVVNRFNTTEQATLTLQGGSYAVKSLSGTGLVSGSGTLEFILSEGTAEFSSDIIATAEGERVSLKISGAGEQIISGSVTAEEIIVNAGTLTLGNTTTNTLSGKGGKLKATGDLSIGSVAQGTSLSTLSVADDATLQIGGGTLAGDALELGDNATLKVCLEKGAKLDFASLELGENITLELLDLYLPGNLSIDTPYQLFANWKEEYQGHISMGESKLGRSTVVFDDENGTITIQGADRADLVWNEGNATWQATTQLTNWDNQGEADSFYNGDNVTFDSVGTHSITLEGDIYTGALTVQQGEIALANAAESTFGVSGKLTIAGGATLTLNTASTTLRGEVEVQRGATLTLNSASTRIEDSITISGGTLNLGSAASVVCEGDILIESGAFSLSGAFTTSGSITLGKDGGAAGMTVKSAAAKSLGSIEVNNGSSLVLYGASANENYANSYADTSVSGSGTFTLRNFGYNELGANGGLLARFLSAEKGIGQLRTDRADLSNNDYSTSLAFTAASKELDALLTSIGDIYIGTGTAIGFASGGANAMANTRGTLHLSGTGTGESGVSNNYGAKGGNAALYVAGATAVKLAWDVTLESHINVTPVTGGSSITLSGTLNGKGFTLTKNGQGSIITAESFNTKADSTGTLLWARGSISFGHTANPDAFKNYTLQMGYNANPGQTGTLTLLSGGTYAVNKLVGQANNNSADKRSAITGNGTLEIWSADAASVYADITAGEGGRVSLAMKGSGTQTISGDIAVKDITLEAGALVLGGSSFGINASGTVALQAGELTLQSAASLSSLTTGAGSLTTGGKLSIGHAQAGTAATYGDITVGGDLALGGGTLKGGQLTLTGKLTVSLAQGSHLDFGSIISSGITLELTDSVLPTGYGKDKAYQLFERWDAASMAGLITFSEMTLGRMTLSFNEQTGAIEFSGEEGKLTWRGENGVSLVWQDSEESALNWTNAATGEAAYFIAGDHVTFNDATGGEVAVHGLILSGDVMVSSGTWSFTDHELAPAEPEGTPTTIAGELTIGGQLTIADGAAAEFTHSATTIEGSAFVSGSLSISGAGVFTNNGSVTIEDGGSVTLSTTGAKTIGAIVVAKGGTLVISGADTDTSALFSNSFTRNTETNTLSSVSGEGTLELSGVYRCVGKVYNVISLTNSANLLASFFPVAGSEAGNGKIGSLKLTNQSALAFASDSVAMKNVISHINRIEVTDGSSLGFASGSSNVLTGTAGTFRIAGSGTGRGSSDASGKYGALFVTGEITVHIPWDIVVDAAGATLYTAPGDYGQNIMKLTGALTLDGATLTKLGNGVLELAEGFTTRAADGTTTDSGTIILGNEDVSSSSLGGGSLVLNYSDENALAGYVIALNHTGNGSGQLIIYDTSVSADSHRYRVKGISDDVTDAVDGKYSYQNKRATIGGYGTLIIDTDETMTSHASIVGGNNNSAFTATLRLEKEGKGKQEILGNVIAKSISVHEGALSLGSSDKTVKVTETLSVEKDASLILGGNLTVGTLTGEGTVAAQGALTLAGDITGFTGTLEATAADAQWTLVGELSAEATLAAQLSGDISVAYSSTHDVTLSGGATAGSTIANAMTGTADAAPGALVLEGIYTGVGLALDGTEIRLGSATAAATWSGSLSGSGRLTLAQGALGAALTREALGSVELAVDAQGKVDVKGTAGDLLSSITIHAGGQLTGVSGDITLATGGTRAELTIGTANLGQDSDSLIETTNGDLIITDTEAFTLSFSAEALAEVLRAAGRHVYLNILSGGSIHMSDNVTLSDILAGDYAALLKSTFEFVSAEDGYIVISGDAAGIYLVLQDGSQDPAQIRDYGALDKRIATVVDEGTTLDIALGDSAERSNTLLVNNLVGLSGSSLRVTATGNAPLTIVLSNSDNGFDSDSSGLPGGLGSADVRGIDTEFKGLILSGEGVNFRKMGTGTLYVGSTRKMRSLAGNGGLSVAGEVGIREGAIVIYGDASEIGALSFDYATQSAADEKRGFTASGSSVAIHHISEAGAYTADNCISLENSGEVIFDGSAELSSTRFSAGTGGGALTVAEGAELSLSGAAEGEAARIEGVDLSVNGGALSLADGASTAGSNISVVNGGGMQVGAGSGITGGHISVQSGSLALADSSTGLRTEGDLSIGAKGVVDLGGATTASSVGGLQGSGELRSGGAQLSITGSGSEFSGSLSGTGGQLTVEKGASFTLKDARTSADAAWNARVRSGATFIVDAEQTSRETHLGTVSLEDNSSFIYKYDTGRSSNLSARLALEDGAHADLTIYSDGASVDPDRELELSGLTFSGDMDNLDVAFKGKAFLHYQGDAHLREGDRGLVVSVSKVQQNLFITRGMQKNARAGAEIFWNAFDSQSAAWKYMQKHPYGDLSRFTDAIYSRYDSGKDMSRMLAAGAGAAVSALPLATQEDMRRHLNTTRNRTATLEDTQTPGDPANMWLSAETGYLKLNADGLAPGFTLNGWGGTAGADVMLQRGVHVGLSLSAMYNDLKAHAADTARGDLDTTYLSAFARIADGAWMHTFIVAGGSVSATLNRTVSYDSGSYSARGEASGFSFGAMYELGYSIQLDEEGSSVIQPLVSLQFRHTALGSYCETGSDAGLRVSDLSADVVTLALGSRYMSVIAENTLNTAAVLELRGLLKADMGDRSGKAATALLVGGAGAEVESAKTGAVGIELGAGISLPVAGSGGGAFFLEGSADFRSRYTNVSASAGYRLSF